MSLIFENSVLTNFALVDAKIRNIGITKFRFSEMILLIPWISLKRNLTVLEVPKQFDDHQ